MNPENEIREAEQRLYRAQLAGDPDALDRLIADDLLFVGPEGKLYGKAMDLEGYRSGWMKIRSLEAQEPEIRPLPPYQVVSVVVDVQGVYAEQPFGGRVRYLRVWASRDGRWQIVAGSCTPVQE
ncbi:nuclear transport factor 2 family protein [Larkinella soli]|uniref:nuclear transport factor 2 family protein n=1 Tax=Larkinella soli TaxID=1770527 RepID=UPI000FFB0662|nr:nuclear transport factor 2 family protein [Larkinella soli]